MALFIVGIVGLSITDGPGPPPQHSEPVPFEWLTIAVAWFLDQMSATLTQIVASGVNGWRRLLQGGIFLLFLGIVVLIISLFSGKRTTPAAN